MIVILTVATIFLILKKKISSQVWEKFHVSDLAHKTEKMNVAIPVEKNPELRQIGNSLQEIS